MAIANQIIRSGKESVIVPSDIKSLAGWFVLPYPPTLNHLFSTNRSGKRFLTNEGRSYKQNAAAMAFMAGVRRLSGPIKVSLKAYRPRKSGDLDNLAKLVLDGMKGIAWNDDSQIVEIHMYRFDDPKNPRLELKIEPA